MKNQIVLWGKNEKDEDILVTLRLRVEDRKVDLWTFDKKSLDEAFVEKMFEDWKGIDPKDFPQPFTHVEREVTNTELLPENIKTTQTDLVIRAEKEWYFQVLAYQVFEQLKTELAAFSEQVKSLTTHSQDFWDEAVSFSNKIKDHTMARTLMRPQIMDLRKLLDGSFEHLKKLMSADRKVFDKEATENYDQVVAKLGEFKTRIEKNENFKEIFDQLKGFQTDLKEVKLKMGHRKDIWGKLNEVFNLVKSKRGSQNSGRLEGRIAGLNKAIDRMERNVNRDKKDLAYHKNAVEKAGSRMEVQLREAKMQLLETTLASKQEKLDDMIATLADLEQKVAKVKEQQAQQKEQEQAKPEAKEEKPINEIAKSAEEKANDLVAKTETTDVDLSDEEDNVLKTETVNDKTDRILEKANAATNKVEAAVNEKTSKIEEMIAKGEEKMVEGNDGVKNPVIEDVEEKLNKVDVKVDEVTTGNKGLETAKDKVETLADKAEDKLDEAKEKVSEVAENLKDKLEEKTGLSFEEMEEKGEELVDNVMDKVGDLFGSLKDKAEEAFDSAHDYVAKKADEAEKTTEKGDDKKDA